MKTISQRNIILDHLRSRPTEWFISHELCQKNLDKGWVGTAGVKRAFELWQDELLEKGTEGNEVKYRYLPQKKTIIKPLIVEHNGERRVRMVEQTLFI